MEEAITIIEIYKWFICLGLLLVAIILLLVGFYRKEKGLKIITCILIILSITFGKCQLKKSHDEANKFNMIENLPRTGNQVYKALFGESIAGCAKIVNYEDLLITMSNNLVLIHADICPEELRRILLQHKYSFEVKPNTNDYSNNLSILRSKEFVTKLLGDTIIEFSYTDNDCQRYIYTSLDSTIMMCIDY